MNSFGELLFPTRNQVKIFIKAEVWISEQLPSRGCEQIPEGAAGEGPEHPRAVTRRMEKGLGLRLQPRNTDGLDRWSDKRWFRWSAVCAEESGGGIRPLCLPTSKGFWWVFNSGVERFQPQLASRPEKPNLANEC